MIISARGEKAMANEADVNLVYQVIDSEKAVKVIRMWAHYE
jgi:Txe/YoeB family toxin of Txe-Axe toxin-antitoxin module